MPWQEVHHAPPGALRCQQAIPDQACQHLGNVCRVVGRNLAQTCMVQHALRTGGDQRQPRQFGQPLETRPKARLQIKQHILRYQAAHAQLHQRLLGLAQFVEDRSPPMPARPVAVDFWQSRSCMIAVADQLEHLLQAAVAAIAIPADYGQLRRHAHQARITKTEHVGPLHHQNRHPPRKIGVNQGIDQGLPQRLMHRCVVNALPGLQLERHFQVHRQLLIDLAKKIVNIA